MSALGAGIRCDLRAFDDSFGGSAERPTIYTMGDPPKLPSALMCTICHRLDGHVYNGDTASYQIQQRCDDLHPSPTVKRQHLLSTPVTKMSCVPSQGWAQKTHGSSCCQYDLRVGCTRVVGATSFAAFKMLHWF